MPVTPTLPASHPPETFLRRSTVLQFEDNPANALLVEELLARRGDLELTTATDASSVVQLALLLKPDVILMDIKMPRVSGVQALALLRANPATASIPVIALSSNAYAGEIKICLEAGFFCYLTKPFRLNVLLDKIDAALCQACESYPRS